MKMRENARHLHFSNTSADGSRPESSNSLFKASISILLTRFLINFNIFQLDRTNKQLEMRGKKCLL